MCLTRIITTHNNPSDLIVDGWKEFRGNSQPFHFMHFGEAVGLDQWINASDIKTPTEDIRASDGKTYKPGFHIYEENKMPYLRRVYLRKISCTGTQDGDKVVIAQEMYVPSNPEAWPPAPAPPPPKKGKLMDRIKKATGGAQ